MLSIARFAQCSRAITASLALVVSLAEHAAAQGYVDCFATSVPDAGANWSNESSAQGDPGDDSCNTTNGPYAINTSCNNAWLDAVAFENYSVPGNQVVTSVRVAIHARYDNGTTDDMAWHVRVPGAGYDSGPYNYLGFASSTSCAWRTLPLELNGPVDFVWSPGLINDIDVSVRKLNTAECNTLRVKAFRLRITTKLDSDGDRVPDDVDNCDFTPNTNQSNADGDAFGDACDNCPFTYQGDQANSDGDGWGNACDNCPGTYQVNQSDVDGDADGDVCDNCPWTPNPNQSNADGDSAGDACDGCPYDGSKLSPGACGCGVPETDSDGDGVPNCIDGCPYDPAKTSPGQCGCGNSDVDTDHDGVADCNDGCPTDPAKTSQGQCGCFVPDADSDGDGVANCIDNCDTIPNPSQADCDLDGEGDACELAFQTQWDTNGNGIPDQCEGCPAIYTYCTAGTSTHGCVPVISAVGTPSISAASGFTIRATGLEGKKFGLVFYGLSGPTVAVLHPASPSFLCVRAPIQRTLSIDSGGLVNSCSGQVSLDLLSFWAQYPGTLGAPFSAGTIVNTQVWYRDPPAPSSTNLSGGLQFTTCP